MAAKTQPIQVDFSGGILSPKLQTRTDTDQRGKSLAHVENFVLTPYGTLANRGGSTFLAECVNSSPVLHTFQRRRNEDVIVEIGETSVQLWDRNGKIDNNVTDNLVQDQGISSADGVYRTIWDGYQTMRAQSNGLGGLPVGTFPIPELIPTSDPRERVTDIVDGSTRERYWRKPAFDIDVLSRPEDERGFFLHHLFLGANALAASTKGFYSTAVGQTITTPVLGEPHTMTVKVNGPNSAGNFTLTGPVPAPPIVDDMVIKISYGTAFQDDTYGSIIVAIPSFGLSIDVQDSFVPAVAEFYLTIETLWQGADPNNIDLGTWSQLNFVSGITNLEIRGTQAGALSTTFNSVWTAAEARQVHVCQDVSKGIMFFFHENHGIRQLIWDGIEWTMGQQSQAALPDNSNWGATLPSGKLNYPSTGAIHNGRLWAASTPLDRSRLWGSKVGTYGEWSPIVPAEADTPVDFTLATSGEIEYLLDSKHLMMGADIADLYGTASTGIISGTDFTFPKQSSWGSAPIQAVEVGSYTVHITADGKKVRALWDTGDSNYGYSSGEMSFFAQHLLSRGTAIELKYGASPNYQLSVVASTGDIVHSLFYPPQQMNGYYVSSTDGDVLSVSYMRETAGDVMWQAVSRGVGVNPYLEYVNAWDDLYRINLDSYVIVEVTDTYVITGLDHLEGKTVGVVGFFFLLPVVYHGEFTVIGGEITVPNTTALGNVAVGTLYTCTATLLEPEGGEITGTAFASKKRWSDIFLRVNDSIMPRVNGVLPQERYPEDPMNLSPAPVGGLRDLRYKDVGWEQEGTFDITQDIPLPTEITALFGKLKNNTR